MSYNEYFYMAVFSNSFSIPWHSIQQHRIKGIRLVSVETAKSQYDFFSLNSRRPSNDFVRFFSVQTTLQKYCEYNLHNNDVYRYLWYSCLYIYIVVWMLKNLMPLLFDGWWLFKVKKLHWLFVVCSLTSSMPLIRCCCMLRH